MSASFRFAPACENTDIGSMLEQFKLGHTYILKHGKRAYLSVATGLRYRARYSSRDSPASCRAETSI